MQLTKTLLAIGGLVWLLSSAPSFAQTNASTMISAPAAASPSINSTSPASSRPAIFHPPGGVPGGILPIRVAGGARGLASETLSLMLLVPDQVGLTTQARPSLYWYQSQATSAVCVISLTEPGHQTPLLVLKSLEPMAAGIHSVRLSNYNFELTPNTIYRWSVDVIINPAKRSQDIIASGIIERVVPTYEQAARLAQVSYQEKTAIFAENGFWYDALQSVSDQIDRAPAEFSLRAQRASLLKQIGFNGTKMDAFLSKSP